MFNVGSSANQLQRVGNTFAKNNTNGEISSITDQLVASIPNSSLLSLMNADSAGNSQEESTGNVNGNACSDTSHEYGLVQKNTNIF